ncbi:MAG: hypothetical protein FWG57_08105 [Endomicrobia bacterium]|nr:hypothetical protein [Endomicrobiia bacterium]
MSKTVQKPKSVKDPMAESFMEFFEKNFNVKFVDVKTSKPAKKKLK